MPNTFTKIAEVTVGAGGAAGITFNSIPATYTDLAVLVSVRSSSGDTLAIRFNGDSATNYSWKQLFANGSTVYNEQSGTGSNTAFLFSFTGRSNQTANTFSNNTFYVPNYVGSTTKTISSDSVNESNQTANAWQAIAGGSWSGTAAITSVAITVGYGGGNFDQYSTATLYGILKGSGGATVS